MAQKKKKHGKVEYRKSRPLLRFRLAVPIVIIIATFVFFFVMYMVSAVTRKDYWEQEILSTMRRSDEDKNARKAVKVTNPVPSSARADASRMGECAFVGDVSVLGNYYELTSGLVFTDAVTDAQHRAQHPQRIAEGNLSLVSMPGGFREGSSIV